MKIVFYNCADDVKTLDKTLTGETVVEQALPYEGCSLLNPRVILEYNADILNKNYAYIEEFKRFYFVGNGSVEKGNRMVIPMTVDPLMSWKDDIRNAPIIAERSSNKYNSYIADPLLNVKAYSQPEYHEIGKFVGTQFYLLGIG